jgi:hypothetical protein
MLVPMNIGKRIIRNENELNRIIEYIIENPSIWDLDNENPKNMEKH